MENKTKSKELGPVGFNDGVQMGVSWMLGGRN